MNNAARYRELSRLPDGGMSNLIIAVDTINNEVVILKSIKRSLIKLSSTKEIDKLCSGLMNESRISSMLEHVNIAQTRDFIIFEGKPTIVMDFINGQSLKHIISGIKQYNIGAKVNIIRQYCKGIDYAHSRGVIHCDLKPGNMMITKDWEVKIIDFGLACPIGIEDEDSIGTVAYAAPEQIEGDRIDERTDIYALGITAYEMATGEKPFHHKNIGKLIQLHIDNDTPDPGKIVTDIPDNLRRFIVKSGKCNPDQRYSNIKEAKEGLGVSE